MSSTNAMGHSVVLTAEAKANLVTIADYIALDSVANAKNWQQRMRERLSSLRHFPTKHEVAYSAEKVGVDVRHTFFGVYRILYLIKGDYVFVLSVRHGARRPLTADEVRRLGNR